MAGPAAQLDEAKRFAEIVAILQKHHLVQGLTPEKVRDIFVDLGPTFVKFGQILSMRSDILPKEYCAALETLRTDVTPMPLTEGNVPHFAVYVDDLDAAAAAVKAAGVDTFMTPEKKVLPNLFGGLENWFFTGPSGEQIELLHML